MDWYIHIFAKFRSITSSCHSAGAKFGLRERGWRFSGATSRLTQNKDNVVNVLKFDLVSKSEN